MVSKKSKNIDKKYFNKNDISKRELDAPYDEQFSIIYYDMPFMSENGETLSAIIVKETVKEVFEKIQDATLKKDSRNTYIMVDAVDFNKKMSFDLVLDSSSIIYVYPWREIVEDDEESKPDKKKSGKVLKIDFNKNL